MVTAMTENRMRTSLSSNTGSQSLVAGWKNLAGDVLSLAGLQLRLFKVDSAQWLTRTKWSIPLLVTGLAFFAGAIPVLMFAGVAALKLAGIGELWSLLIVGGVALTIGCLSVAIAARRLRHALSTFNRSYDEMAENLEWLKSQLSRESN